MGLGAGVLGVVGSTFLHRKGYVATSNALAGGAAVALYASLWAAHDRYRLFSFPVSFAGMAVVMARWLSLHLFPVIDDPRLALNLTAGERRRAHQAAGH